MIVAFVAPQGAFATSPLAHGTFIVFKFVHPLKAFEAIEFGLPWNVIEVNPVHLENALPPTLVIPLGKLVKASFEQP